MIAALGVGLLGMLVLSATPPDISGEWTGDGWGRVVLKETSDAEYAGTYTDTAGKQPGEIELKWSRIERRFNGTWREGEDRFGDISVRLVGDEIRGALTTDAKSKINPATPRLADLAWTRVGAAVADQGGPPGTRYYGSAAAPLGPRPGGAPGTPGPVLRVPPDRALHFDGRSGYVEIGNSPSLLPKTITVALWFKCDRLDGSSQTLLNMNNAVGRKAGSESYEVILNRGDSSNRVTFEVYDGTDRHPAFTPSISENSVDQEEGSPSGAAVNAKTAARSDRRRPQRRGLAQYSRPLASGVHQTDYRP